MKRIAFVLLAAMLLTIPLARGAWAKDFFDVIKYGVSGGVVKDVDAALYNAKVTGAFNDPNLDGNLDPGETIIGTMKLFDRGGKLVAESPPDISRDQLEAWALLNAQLIMGTIFEGSLSQVTGQSDDALMGGSKFSEKILEKVKPASSEFKGALEYQRVKVNGDDGNSYSAVLGYEWGFDSELELGLMMPYRFTGLDDQASSKSNYLGLDFYAKYPVKKWDKVTWNVGGDVFGSAFLLQSDAIDLLGNLKYGAGVFTSVGIDLGFGRVSVGCDYMIADANIPDSLVDTDDNKWVEDAIEYINDLEMVQTVTYGANLGIPFAGDKAAVNLEVVRSNFISSDLSDGRKAQTTAMVSVAYRPTETFEMSLGVNQTYELEDIDVWGVTFGTLLRF